MKKPSKSRTSETSEGSGDSDDSTIDSVVQRATNRLFRSGAIVFLRYVLIGVAGLLVGSLGISAYQVATISERAGQAKQDIDNEIRKVSDLAKRAEKILDTIDAIERDAEEKIENAAEKIEDAARRITKLEGSVETEINTAQQKVLDRLDDDELRQIEEIRQDVKAIDGQIKTLKDTLSTLIADADASLAFVRISKEIDNLRAELNDRRDPERLGLVVTSNIGWLAVVASLVLAVGIGFLLGWLPGKG